MKSSVRVRFAPSPTGHLHVGGARVAIFNWLFAKHNGGSYLLRIEDTDQVRSKKEYLESQLDAFKWLSIISDEPPVFQLSRLEEHKRAAEELLAKDLAYKCYCEPRTQEELGETANVGYKYPGTCRDKKKF